MLKRICTFCLLGMLVFIALPSLSQNMTQQDFSNIRVDELTDAQIRQFMTQADASGLGDEQLEQIAAARGMSSSEIAKLRKRVDLLKKQDSLRPRATTRSTSRTVNNPDEQPDENAKPKEPEKKPILTDEQERLRAKIFGAALFANANLTFEPNLRLATPKDYQIGPDDEILIDIYGYSEASYQLKVSPDGNINIPMVGVVAVSGATIEQVSSRIRAKLSKIYTGISTGATSVNISLGNIRSIRVILTGDVVKPGTYSLPSVATVFNALYASGGPTENGSFRTIQVIRSGTVIAALDVYDFLLYGSLKNNVRLQDQDVIRVPTYRTRVEINGQVKREGIFEMMPSETLSDLIRFAGDFNEKAYKARIKVLKNTETERKIEDVTATEFSSYTPSSGDEFFVDKILDRFKNRVKINGAVFRPGEYELTEGLTLTQLVKKAEGLKEDAFPNRGYITRVKDDLTSEMLTFSPADIINGRTTDISLRREDIVNIPSIFDLKEEYNLTINGEVRFPGTFPFAENTSVEALILKAGGLKEGATPKRIEIARRVKTTNSLNDTTQTAQVFYLDIDQNLKQATRNFALQPFDIVSVRPAPGYQVQKTVKIEGEVLYPGTYTITNKTERVSDLIKRAGGFTSFAYKDGASLKRANYKTTELEQEKESLKLKQFETLQKATTDSAKIDVKEDIVRNDYVGIDLPRIMDHPGRRYDLLLENGDVLNIPKQLQTVKVSGEVLSPSSVVFSGAKGFKSYVLESGGFSPKALKRRSYIIYANGAVAGTKKFLLFNRYPNVKPGAEIFVPKKEEKSNRLSTSEIVAITTGIATIATLVFTIIR